MKTIQEYKILNLDFDTTSAIYQKYIAEHFASNEIKPLASIERMWKLGFYRAMAVVTCDGNESTSDDIMEHLIGYAFFTTCPDGRMLLLDYLAIRKEFRGSGFGGIFLKELQRVDCGEQLAGILIETEDLLYAQNEDERTERLRRNSFYRENGAVSIDLHTCIYDARYEIWQLPLSEELSKEECREELIKIYHFILPDVPEGDQRVQI